MLTSSTKETRLQTNCLLFIQPYHAKTEVVISIHFSVMNTPYPPLMWVS